LIIFAANHFNLFKLNTRNRLRQQALALLITLLVSPLHASVSIEKFISALPAENIRVLEKEAFYSNIYEIMFEQPIDHNNPEKGSFQQRIYVSHIDESLPVVFVTEGYSAGNYYTSEPAWMLRCNQIIAEHRYFGESVPDSIQWEYLTTWQSATDHHRIIEKFKELYQDKWITTGISKGGQTVMFHSYYYPDDVDARIPYVAPLNHDIEDQRVYEFLDNVGSKACRKKIRKFQKYALKHQDELMPAFRELSEKKNYTYTLVGGTKKAFEYCVLEYSFAFWQWGYESCSGIPDRRSSPEEIIAHMNKVAGFDYFADKFILEYQPFFYQAYTEMGYYGYDLGAFRHQIRHVTDPGFEFTLPENSEINFNRKLLLDLDQYIRNDAENFIFIYGEYDTWSATAVELSGNTNSRIFFKESGSHRTRIKNMPLEQQEEIQALLKEFLHN
jgi:hypothetical protein